jgi:anaerobic selenocysteine-containing dehydrogenase
LLHVIIKYKMHDPDYVAQHTVGFEQLQDRVQSYTPEKVSGWTGIAADDIRKLAREYATVHPAVIRANYGIQRTDHGGMAVRAVTMLPCITGSWKEVGGGLQLSLSGAFPLIKDGLERMDLMTKTLGRPARIVNMSQLAMALGTLNDPPIKSLFVYASNPAAVAPNHNEVVRQLKREDLFTVVHEQFLTDTTDYADIVLPATTFFEHKDLQKAYGHYYLQMSEQAIEPLGESKSNVDLFRELGLRFGFEDECFRETVDEMIDRSLTTDHTWLKGIDRQRLETEKHIRLNFGADPGTFLPFANGGFFTKSGKAELYSEVLAAQGMDPVVSFQPPKESRHVQNGNSRYPFELLARKADNFLNSSFCNVDAVRAMETPGLLEINPADASAKSIHEGAPVRLFNDRGEIRLTAKVTDSVQPGVLGARLDWAKSSQQGININVLVSERLTDLGRGATFYSVLVDVQPL